MSSDMYNNDIVWMDTAEIQIFISPSVISTSINNGVICSKNNDDGSHYTGKIDDGIEDLMAAVEIASDDMKLSRSTIQESISQPIINTILLKLVVPTTERHKNNNDDEINDITFCCIPLQVMSSSLATASTATASIPTKTTTSTISGIVDTGCTVSNHHQDNLLLPLHVQKVIVRIHPLLYEFMILYQTEMINHHSIHSSEIDEIVVEVADIVTTTTDVPTATETNRTTTSDKSTAFNEALHSPVAVTIAPLFSGYPDNNSNNINGKRKSMLETENHQNVSTAWWYIEGLVSSSSSSSSSATVMLSSWKDPDVIILSSHNVTLNVQIIYQYDTHHQQCYPPDRTQCLQQSTTNIEDQPKQQSLQRALQMALWGKIITEGAILLLPVVMIHNSMNSNKSSISSIHNDIHYYLIRIHEIIIHDKTTLPTTSSSTTSLYRIDENENSSDQTGPTINIVYINIQNVDRNNDQPHDDLGRSNDTSHVEGRIQPVMNHKHCPGYEALQMELLQLMQLSLQNSTISVPNSIVSLSTFSTTLTTATKAAPSGILLTGCAGVGKTRLLSTILPISNESSSSSSAHQRHYISVHNLILLASWADEVTIMDAIHPPHRYYQLLVIDDLHILGDTSSTTTTTNRECRLVLNSLIQVIDRINNASWLSPKESLLSSFRVVIVGLGRDKSLIPSELLKVGRLEKEIQMLPPSQAQREVILYHLLLGLKYDTTNCVAAEYEMRCQRWADVLATATPGCVAADLRRICSNAWSNRFARSALEMNDTCRIQDVQQRQWPVSWLDLSEAARNVTPSQLVMLDVTKPKQFFDICSVDNWSRIHELSWETFAGYDSVKKRIYRSVVVPWRRQLHGRNDSIDTGYAIIPPSGILFHGPSGCGKTMAAHCLGSSLGLPMIRVRAADIMDKWLGGSEATLRSLFARARSAAPCILFFDEIDAVASNRASSDGVTADVMSRLLSTLLNEMDGISSCHKSSVVVVACTNRLESLDAALLRPGRLEEHITLTLPSQSDTLAIFEQKLMLSPLEESVDLNQIAKSLAHRSVSGADIEGICREAIFRAIRRCTSDYSAVSVTKGDIERAVAAIKM